MTETRRSDTIVLQTFRNHDIPAWTARCLESVRGWAALHGHDYVLAGDEFYALCGPDYLARGSKNPQAITNLARLVAARQRLDAGYSKVIWMDADIFVFDPVNLLFEFPDEPLATGYAFGREVWLFPEKGRIQISGPKAHNAAAFFTERAVDLDMLIMLIRHIDAGREMISNFQVGVELLRGLQYSLMFPTFTHVGAFSPFLLGALVHGDQNVLRLYGEACRYKACAANLGLSTQHITTEAVLWRAMDRLEQGAGDAINRYATETGVHLVPFG